MKKQIFLFAVCFIFISFEVYSNDQNKYWVFFKDKGYKPNLSFQKGTKEYLDAINQLSDRAIQRRLKVLLPDAVVSYEDLPLNEMYVKKIQELGGILEQKVKWLNAASFILTDSQVQLVKSLDFVKLIEPVKKLIGIKTEPFIQKSQNTSSFDTSAYGLSFAQYSVVKIPELHRLGLTGDSVIIGMLDTGFRWRRHESLKDAKVIAEWDFINNDDTTANQTSDPSGQDLHGTLTMSIIGSFYPGKIIAPAYNASFLLAKTEYVPTETRIEEDWWAAGIEWLENKGADVVSSSLGYNIFDDGSGYRWENGDFDGRTAVTTKAATRAARLGVVVVTAMGNEGNGNGIRGTLLCPADADSIISVGAITIQGTLAYFSSTGPTNDGRIKPDVVAPGVSIYSAVTPGPSSYGFSQGTSASTPITAGIIALLLSARPDLTPIQIRHILRNTSDAVDISRFPNTPNNFTGWGRINAYKALFYPSVHKIDNLFYVSTFLGNSKGIIPESAKLIYTINNFSFDTLQMIKYYGKSQTTNGAYRTIFPALQYGTIVKFYISVFDSNYNQIRLPEDSSKFFSFVYGLNDVVTDTKITIIIPGNFKLVNNYPNPFPSPFNPGTTIILESPIPTQGIIEIYNLLGQKVRTLYSGVVNPGINYYFWDTKNDLGFDLPSGVYFLKASINGQYASDLKLLLIR